MRRRHFEALRPLCPACRQQGLETPLVLRAGSWEVGQDIRNGLLECIAGDCGRRFPIINGVPVLVPDVPSWLAANAHLMLQRDDLSEEVEALIGDALGADTAFNLVRQQQSTYAHDHYGDLYSPHEGEPGHGSIRRCLDAALGQMSLVDGPILDIGCAVGRTSFDLAERTGRIILGIDMNWQLLQIGRRIIDDGVLSYPFRRIGNRYERRTTTLSMSGAESVDLWIANTLALPFAGCTFAGAVALNVFDCVPDPVCFVREMARVLAPGGSATLTTPLDWATHATPESAWLTSPDDLARLLAQIPLLLTAPPRELDWTMRLHDNARMCYRTLLFVARRLGPSP